MQAKIIALKKQSPWEKALDTKGNPVPNLYRHIRSGTYHVWKNFKRLGIKPLRESTRQTTLGKARTEAELIIQRHKNRCLGIDDTAVFLRKKGNSFGSAAKLALEKHTPRKRRARTQEKHNLIIPALIEKWGSYQLKDISSEGFKDWIDEIKAEKWACGQSHQICLDGKCGHRRRQTFMDYAKHMNFVMRIAFERKLIDSLITFENPDEEKETGRVFTRAEITALWNVMGDDTRDQFVLCFESMMRLREALYLTWDRVNLKTGQITLRKEDVKTGSKTGKGRDFIMSKNSLVRMKARFEKTKHLGSTYVFPAKEKLSKRWNILKPQHDNDSAWNRSKKAAGITGPARWHDLRHTAISEALLVQGHPIVKVSEYCGTSVATLQRVYLHSKAEQTKDVATAIRIEGISK